MAVGLGMMLVGLGCRTVAFTPLSVSPTPPCVIDDRGALVLDSVRVWLPPSEEDWTYTVRVGHTLQTLVTLDCTGRMAAGLATAWHVDDTGMRWTFRLRDGTGVTTDAIAQHWRMLDSRGVDAVRAVTAREVEFLLSEASGDPWRMFASPVYAMPSTRAAPSKSVIQPVEDQGSDVRDLLDRGVDVVVTADPDAIEYAQQHPDFVVQPLPWQQTYGLFLPHSDRLHSEGANALPVVFLEALATEAVRRDARAHQVDTSACSIARPATTVARDVASRSGSRTLVYLRHDPTTRDLAERLVVLHTMEGDALPPKLRKVLSADASATALTLEGVSRSALVDRVARGGEDIILGSLPTLVTTACNTDLFSIYGDMDDVLWQAWATGRFLPLVDTRAHLLVRKGVGPLRVDAFGQIWLTAFSQASK